MSKKDFDFDKFNAELQKSTAICAKGKADIDRAIKVGKGEAIWSDRVEGLVVKQGEFLCVVAQVSADQFTAIAINRNQCNRMFDPVPRSSTIAKLQKDGYTFVANSIAEHLAAGGKVA